ncbi:MAG: DMT family transporter [Burkholderiales bacterium]
MSLSAGARSAYIGVACAILGSIAFSGKTIIVKLAYQHGVDVLTLLALRMLFSLPFFLIMAWMAGAAHLSRRDWLGVAALGFIGYYVGSYLDFAGLQYISAGLGRLILYLYPTIVVLMSALFLKQPIRKRHLASLALSYSGIALVFNAEIQFGGDWNLILLGAGLVFASAIAYAIYLIAGSRYVLTLGSTRFTAYAATSASFFVIAHFMALRGPSQLAVSNDVYLLVLIMAIFTTVTPLWLMAEGLKRIGANQVALVGCIGPLSTMVFGQIFLGEVITLIQLLGAGLVLAGVLIISVKPQAATASKM